jgi:RHS repeat-associated protein
VTYLFSDHLGSTNVSYRVSDGYTVTQRYYAWGAVRPGPANELPTEYAFTGQRVDGYNQLMYYGARWYDPQTGRFVQADTILPDPSNPQSLNRYSYVLNNPLCYTDPGGYDPIDAQWEKEFFEAHGRHPTDEDRADRFFSLLFLGRGPDGTWTDSDWAYYSQNRKALWTSEKGQWPGVMAPGLDRFRVHLKRLAAYYSSGEEVLFTKAVGFIWGGMPLGPVVLSGVLGGLNPCVLYPCLYEGAEGWHSDLVDDKNPSHHYAGLFWLGFFAGHYIPPDVGGFVAGLLNFARDGPWSDPSEPDLKLGDLAVDHGVLLAIGRITIGEVELAIGYACDAGAGLWPMDTPGSRVPWWL